jgi:hypothetical protein
MADDYRHRPTPPPVGGFVATHEAAALWRAREEDRKDADRRFDRIEQGVEGLKEDMVEVRTDLGAIKTAEETRAKSAEKRNQRLWQVGSGVLVSLLVAIVIALWKVFAPIAIVGHSVKPERVIDTVDDIRKLEDGSKRGER